MPQIIREIFFGHLDGLLTLRWKFYWISRKIRNIFGRSAHQQNSLCTCNLDKDSRTSFLTAGGSLTHQTSEFPSVCYFLVQLQHSVQCGVRLILHALWRQPAELPHYNKLSHLPSTKLPPVLIYRLCRSVDVLFDSQLGHISSLGKCHCECLFRFKQHSQLFGDKIKTDLRKMGIQRKKTPALNFKRKVSKDDFER